MIYLKKIKWFITFIIGVMLGFVLIASVNIFVDPFGAFGDPVLDYWGYNFTNNPRIAKITYLDKHYKNYDSYIIGSSKTSSISPDLLNEYFPGSKFYNMMVYGADLYTTEHLFNYITENYNPKNIVIHLGISELENYRKDVDDIKQLSNARFSGDPLLPFYKDLVFANPQYSVSKLSSYLARDYISFHNANNIFIPERGNYNKTARDAENIVNVRDYKNSIGGGSFLSKQAPFEDIDHQLCVDAVANMKKYCDDNGINFIVISCPNYDTELLLHKAEKIKAYWIDLANITDFWNFSAYNTYSSDPRYFYDYAHYRNSLGELVLARMFSDSEYSDRVGADRTYAENYSIELTSQNGQYTDDGFGILFTAENAAEMSDKLLVPSENHYLDNYSNDNPLVKIPIIKLDMGISAENFENHLSVLAEAGYKTVTYSDLIDFVYNNDTFLPEKAICITVDNASMGVFQKLLPVLTAADMKICMSVDGENAIDAASIADSGYADVANHSFAYSNTEKGLLIAENESHSDYISRLNSDCLSMSEFYDFKTLVYPHGNSDLIADRGLKFFGYKMTVMINNKFSTVQKGNPYSLFALYRVEIPDDISGSELLDIINNTKT